ncbi:hypothetical protein, partial [Heyndrickxia sporothermodurans]|uniref:hypothetical protein n=1 Tax=Heyndrickxia sporothermodurans TaxID=46224 RepID=UPI001F3D48FD
YMRCLNGGLLVNYHYTRFGEVLLFLSLKPLDTQGLRIMKFIQIHNDFSCSTACYNDIFSTYERWCYLEIK